MPNSSTPITPQIVAEHGFSEEEYQRVLHAMGREPNITELGIFSVMPNPFEEAADGSALGHLRSRRECGRDRHW
jgi:hypothetical protein